MKRSDTTNDKKEDLLDFVGYHPKWHGQVQRSRREYEYNQNDYLIEEIFRRIGVTSGFFVEFGAWDGIYGSNTRKLFKEGWSGILIEPDETRFNNLQNNYSDNQEVTTLNTLITTSGDDIFDNVVDQYVSGVIDFCSIDIDGMDLDVFETIEKHLPNVICIEGGQMLNPTHGKRLPTNISKHNIQQGIRVMNDSFEKKGYKLICTYQDSFFVKEEYYGMFNVKEDLIDLYLDGILAYPRIPWILDTLSKVGLTNDVLEYIMSNVSYCHPQASSEQKSQWVDENYSNICEIVEKIRKVAMS